MSLTTFLFCMPVAVDIVINAIVLIYMLDDANWELLSELFNPSIIYKEHKVNYFGCFMIMIFWHVILAPFAIGYWIFMLTKLFIWFCTIGRR